MLKKSGGGSKLLVVKISEGLEVKVGQNFVGSILGEVKCFLGFFLDC